MTEIKPQIQNRQPFKQETGMLEKRWITAKTNPNKVPSYRNSIVEFTYNNVLKLAKRLYSQLESTSERTVFEKDHRYDSSENSLAMHTLLTPNFYWHLECSFDYLYRIEYDFHKCPFEEQFTEQIHIREHYMPGSTKHWHTRPDCKGFFNRVVQVQDAQYIHVLPHNAISF